MTPEERAHTLQIGLCRIDAISGSSATAAFIEKELAREIREAVAEERELCAQIAETLVVEFFGYRVPAKPAIAAAIRKRGS